MLDSEPYYYRFLNAKFDEFGIEVSQEEYDGFVGLPTRKVWSYLVRTKPLHVDVDTILQKEEEEVNTMFQQADLKPLPGVVDLLEILISKKVPMNVASSSAKSTIRLIVEKLGMTQYFKFLLSGTEVANGKPHPDIFLRSAELHKLPPEEGIVIEDSHNGVKAAKAAGMTCIGFRNPGSGQQDLSEADIIVSDYSPNSINTITEFLR